MFIKLFFFVSSVCWVKARFQETNPCFFPLVGAWAGGVWEGERRSSGVRQLCPATDRRLLPRHPGAGGQCPGGVMLTTLTSGTSRLTPALHVICSWAQVPLPPLNQAPGRMRKKLGHYLSFPSSLPSSTLEQTFTTTKCFPVSCVSLMSGLYNQMSDVHKMLSNMALWANIRLHTANGGLFDDCCVRRWERHYRPNSISGITACSRFVKKVKSSLYAFVNSPNLIFTCSIIRKVLHTC